MPATTAPAAIPVLIDLVNTALTGWTLTDHVEVYDGGPVTDIAPDYIAVGYRGGGGGDPAITSTQEVAEAGNRVRSEDFEVWCEASSAGGDTEEATPRAAVAAMLNAIAVQLHADPTLGGLITGGGLADLAQIDWFFDQTETGASCTAVFAVRIQNPYFEVGW